MEMEFSSEITVTKIGGWGGDWLAVDAARVSTKHSEGSGPRVITDPKDIGLIKALMKQRHFAPFQHGSITFYVEAPIFVFREWRTHRIAMVQTTDDFSYSEASARYKPLKPKFWMPSTDRPMIKRQDHKAMRPVFDVATEEQYHFHTESLECGYKEQWAEYETMLENGCAPEVARAVLGTGVYSSMYVSANPLSALHFISLRTHDDSALFVSYPQLEIETAARTMETMLREDWPVTLEAFKENGRFA